MTREILNLNTDWFFIREDIEEARDPDFNSAQFKEVSLPHSNKILPHHYFSEEDYQFVSWYRRPFFLDNTYSNKRIILQFDGVMSVAEVFINGKKVGIHKGGYTPFSFDISEYLHFDQKNLLAVRVDSTCRKDLPPEGNVVDYLLFGGIYRNAVLKVVNPLYINRDFWKIEEAS